MKNMSALIKKIIDYIKNNPETLTKIVDLGVSLYMEASKKSKLVQQDKGK